MFTGMHVLGNAYVFVWLYRNKKLYDTFSHVKYLSLNLGAMHLTWALSSILSNKCYAKIFWSILFYTTSWIVLFYTLLVFKLVSKLCCTKAQVTTYKYKKTSQKNHIIITERRYLNRFSIQIPIRS